MTSRKRYLLDIMESMIAEIACGTCSLVRIHEYIEDVPTIISTMPIVTPASRVAWQNFFQFSSLYATPRTIA